MFSLSLGELANWNLAGSACGESGEGKTTGESKIYKLPSPQNTHKQRASGRMVKGEGKFYKTFREEKWAVFRTDKLFIPAGEVIHPIF